MKPPRVSEKSPYRLLVEGKDDQHTVIHLLRRHGLDYDAPTPNLPYIHAAGGCTPLLESLTVAAKSYERLGILVDADQDPQNRWDEIRRRLEMVGVRLPEFATNGGTCVTGVNRPDSRIGIWLMPDNLQAGTLETFLSRLVPPGDSCWLFAATCTEEAGKMGAKFPKKYFSKAQLHTWLAWQAEPGMPFGTALTAACFASDRPKALDFVNWFKRLFLANSF